MKKPVCNLDCFNCIYDDCINEGDLSDSKLSAELDREAKRDGELTPYQKYRHTEKGKAAIKRYQVSDKGKAAQYRANHSEKGKARFKAYEQTEKRKAYRREWQKRRREALKNNL